jgi:thiol-disulfide isomerase/thioredoxin
VLASVARRIDVPEKSAGRTIDAGELPLAPADRPAAGAPVPKLEGKSLTGDNFSLDSYRGKVIVLDFWATWCGPCREATPRVRAIHEEYSRGGKFAVVGITFDHQPETAKAYADSEKLPWPNVLADGWGQDGSVVRAFGISAIPSLWVIGADGKVIARDVAPEEIEKVVGEMMQ